MANAGRDDNRRPTWLLKKPDGSKTPLLIDNATGRILAKLVFISGTPTIPTEYSTRDDNRMPVTYAKGPTDRVSPILITNGAICSAVTPG